MRLDQYKYLVISILGVEQQVAMLVVRAANLDVSANICDDFVIVLGEVGPVFREGQSDSEFCPRSIDMNGCAIPLEAIGVCLIYAVVVCAQRLGCVMINLFVNCFSSIGLHK